MPRERNEIFRESNSRQKEKIIVLAFEGNIAEEEYFEELKIIDDFNEDLIYLHLLKRPRNDTNSAPNHVFNKLKREAKEEYNFDKKDELWMIIDTDRWKNIPSIISLCKAQGNMFVAVSNPCFEVWLLLHVYQEIASITEEDKINLLENRRISTTKRYIDKFLGDSLKDGYNKRNPRVKRFIENVRQAIVEAKSIHINEEDFPSKLGTDVFKVVEKLLK